ncbi:hypothetical protein Z043_108591 [Scleropages formosus]|uniref:Suppressor of white apricot N-terminal domain-containing protein n=1 Tax=Scleropages formosus TaxID=113540 RepID=A0A0P7VBA5_SCLFO|nr:hypothetical protein Z043_108591 [Scleropages formosus]
MWQEARKHERKLRGMMVDYKRRGERRREYYEKIKKDPAQFLQVHGRAYKIHLDSAVALAAESPANITPEQESEERKCNYERYRGLVQNDFASISEEQCLYQIYLDELYGGLPRPNEDEKKKLAEKKASIGYTYEDSTVTEPSSHPDKGEADDDSENNVEVDVDELNQEQVQELNKMATPYGMADGDFVRMLRKDKEEVEAIKHAKALEAEKAMYSGRRSRRQRREFREKRLKGRQISPPSYARRDSPTYDPYKRMSTKLKVTSKLKQKTKVRQETAAKAYISCLHSPQSESSSESRSRSRSPGQEKITFITSFGGSDDEGAPAAPPQPAAHASHAPSNSQQHHPAADAVHPPVSLRHPPRPPPAHHPVALPPGPPAAHVAADDGGGGTADTRGPAPVPVALTHGLGEGAVATAEPVGVMHGPGLGPARVLGTGTGGGATLSAGAPDNLPSIKKLRSRSDSRTGDRFRRQGRSSGPRRGGSSSASPTQSPGLSRSPSPPPRHAPPTAMALCDKLRKPDTAGGKETGAAKPKMTPQEKLRLRMQKALNKQCKADKKAAQVKIQQQEHKRQEREGELRAMARKIRMKERERREKERDEWERQYGRQSHSPSPTYKYNREHSSSRRRSRSRSRSPYYRY